MAPTCTYKTAKVCLHKRRKCIFKNVLTEHGTRLIFFEGETKESLMYSKGQARIYMKKGTDLRELSGLKVHGSF